MEIDCVHFYVEDARVWRDWFVCRLGFTAVESGVSSHHTLTEAVKNGTVHFLLSSPLSADSPVAQFLQEHPPGVADVAFRVGDLSEVMAKAVAQGAKVLQPIQERSGLKWSKISGWGDLSHTLIEGRQGAPESGRAGDGEIKRSSLTQNSPNHQSPVTFLGIDHIVLNVRAGELEAAITWYEKVLGFQRQQAFEIQTELSALYSQVLVHPSTAVKFPINEPASPNSQIQEFLDLNRGPGIQHIALRSANLIETTQLLRSFGLAFLQVPPTYYTQLRQREKLPLKEAEFQEIVKQQILVDWQHKDGNGEIAPLLLQIFTQPIFVQPTFFFELIERRVCWVDGEQKRAAGFGEGNFRALFEAIEREQMKRGSL